MLTIRPAPLDRRCGIAALLVSPSPAADWLRRLAAEPALRQRLGDTARADIARQLSPETFARNVAALLKAGQAT